MSRYEEGHPLHGVSQDVLDAARKTLYDAATWGDVDPDVVDSMQIKLIGEDYSNLFFRPRNAHGASVEFLMPLLE